MKFKQTAILSTILCLVLNILINHFAGYEFHFAAVIGGFIPSNILVVIYLIVKRKEKKSGLLFLLLQNIFPLFSLIGTLWASN
jgi:hydrogenase maturation factor|tara:strand:- start:109 stop:357 length:249 start_codon:yes stop_codon:yes gene_type:complete